MTSFQARTKEELYTPEPNIIPGKKAPSADFNGLRPHGANEFFPRIWQYRHNEHTLADLMKPGYFCDEARDHLRPGDEIFYTLEGKKKLPSAWERGIAVVEFVPNSKEHPVILAGFVKFGKPSVWGKKEDFTDGYIKLADEEK